MSKKKILTLPDPILREVSEPVNKVDKEIKHLMDDMLETMYAAPGIGLAAVQIGILKRVIVIDLSKDNEKKDPIFIVNPKILSQSKELVAYEEGCLSIPGFNHNISRPDNIELKWQDLKGKEHEIKPEGMLSICIQHEIDHLDGKLMVDYVSALKRDRVRKRLLKEFKRK